MYKGIVFSFHFTACVMGRYRFSLKWTFYCFNLTKISKTFL
ncbi:hypothetical protein HMPREF0020_03850 [Acinetobacter baumannii 6013113]|nr:hypothetical protein HMPREF0020_03850 [Acinetobacter baumannii 6013113]